MINDNIELIKISDLLNKYYITLPSFQRAYTWNKTEIQQFLNDLENSAINNKYFIGSIYASHINEDRICIIDGQQRITTLFLILNGIRILDKNLFDSLDVCFFDEKDEPRFDSEVASSFCGSLFSESLEESFEKLKIEPGKDFTKINLYYCQVYVNDYLKKHLKIRDNILKIMNNVEMILILCNEMTYGYQIYENINSKGQLLNNADLIKNAFFYRIKKTRGEKEFTSFKYRTWKEIENNFYINITPELEITKLGVKNNEAVSNFHQLFAYYIQLNYKKNHSRNSRLIYTDYVKKLDEMEQEDLKNELIKIRDLSDSYTYFFKPFEKSVPKFESVFRSIEFLSLLGTTGIKIYIPFALAMINKITKERKYLDDKEKVKKIFCKISIFHFIFNTTFGLKPSFIENNYNDLGYNIYSKNIKLKEIASSIDYISPRIIEEKIGIDISKVFEDYRDGLTGVLFTVNRASERIQKLSKYNFKDNFEIKYILGCIEEKLKNDFSTIPDISTIEHINNLAGTGNDVEYNFSIFNMIPLETKINAECADKSIEEKIPYYKSSNYLLPKRYAKIYEQYKNDPSILKEEWEKEIIGIIISILKMKI